MSQIDEEKKSLKIHTKASVTESSFLYSMFNLSLSDMVDLVNENMLLFTFLFVSILSAYFFPLELKETLRPPTNDFGKVQRVFTSAWRVRACLQLLCSPVS